MNKANLKSYAPQARQDFIAAVSARASILGITAKGNSPIEVRGDVALIDGREWPKKVVGQRSALIERIELHGFQQVIEEVAYTWFNRFAALRFMEIHDYLDHGWRVLSSRDNGLPEILGHASELSLGGLSQAKAQEMQLAGNQDNELYKLLLVAQCNALSNTMPFLFERIDDQTELLLPDNLLRTDSIIAKLVAGVPEEDWQEIEIIGWLYQFYISEKKDQVIGKVVKSEDIPAATQLFTPNWIVQYLVQNSVGRLWLMANPQSTLAKDWPYYITPAEQTPEVQAQLDALIQTRVREDGDTLNPESITVLDPACGSGHILVVAYDVLKAIYLERGYQPRTIPRLILEKNLFGLDIDDRAAQMAGFALLMKARADDRRLFTATDDAGNLQPPKLNVLSLQESKGLSVDELSTHLTPFKVQRATITALVDTFEHAKTFGSLLQIPYALKTHLAVLTQVLALVKQSGDMYASAAADDLLPLVQQALVLAMQFDAVVANPPYMGGKGMNPALKEYANSTFQDSKSDLFAMFIERGFAWCKETGFNSMVTMQSWMFLSSYEAMREKLMRERTLSCMVHMGNGVMGIAFGTAATVLWNKHIPSHESGFSYCGNDDIGEGGFPTDFPVKNDRLKIVMPDDFSKIPGSPVAYWISKSGRSAFVNSPPMSSQATVACGMTTGDNGTFTRRWFEVSFQKIGLRFRNAKDAKQSNKKWFPYNKGGEFRKWYGNNEFVVNWRNDGADILATGRAYPRAKDNYFKESVTWSFISSSYFGVRYSDPGFVFDMAGCSAFPDDGKVTLITGLLCASTSYYFLKFMNPTLNFQVGNVSQIPLPVCNEVKVSELASNAISLSRKSWDSFEVSWDFSAIEFASKNKQLSSLSEAWSAYEREAVSRVVQLKSIEEENNLLFINAYGLQDELTPEVPESQITLARADREKDSQRLISYAIGCMMGRYSLDEPGLIYADAGNVGFDPTRYATFPADADGIVPNTDELWFADDAPSRISEFLRAVWGSDTLEENMAWLAESLGIKASETPDEAIRRYIADKFFKDHMQTYKKRPIYWHFSSGKQGAFQALVYLHRYNEGTLARMRSEYVVPLTSKFAYRLDMLEKDASASSSTAARTKIQKQIESLRKKQTELMAFEEKLRHYADMRINIDLDDGVKVNYAKFGDLLAESKAITGGADE